MVGPPSFQPGARPPSRPAPGKSGRGFSGFTLIASVLAALLFGVSLGVGLMLLWPPPSKTSTDSDAGAASASATASAEASADASASASASAEKDDATSAAAAAYARKLAALKKKVKAGRARALDPQCKKLRPGLSAGYTYSGGTYSEMEFVANANGCQSLARTNKAPWFCCRK